MTTATQQTAAAANESRYASGVSRGRREQHRRSKTSEYMSWQLMKRRCLNPNDPGFPGYGKKGVKVCDRWLHSFTNFLADMGLKPTPRHTLDRIDNARGYEPSNCRWATPKEQARNFRKNVNLTFNGKTQAVSAWTEELGYPRGVIDRRIRKGWPVEDALLTPPRCGPGKRTAKRLREKGIIK